RGVDQGSPGLGSGPKGTLVAGPGRESSASAGHRLGRTSCDDPPPSVSACRRPLLWLSAWLSQRPNLAGMDGNRTHPGRLNSAPQTVLKTAEDTSPRSSPALRASILAVSRQTVVRRVTGFDSALGDHSPRF